MPCDACKARTEGRRGVNSAVNLTDPVGERASK
jgi:hypothetical protein